MVRERLFNVRFGEDEWARLEALTEHYGLSAASVVRLLMKEKARELGLEATPATSATRPRARTRQTKTKTKTK